MAIASHSLFEFGPYKVDPQRRVLARDGVNVALAPKTFDLLLLFVEGRGKAFSKQELITALWPGTFVEESSLCFQVSALRKALGEKGAEWVENLPRYGYRFSCEVSEIDISLQDDITSAIVSGEHGQALIQSEIFAHTSPTFAPTGNTALLPSPQAGDAASSGMRRLLHRVLIILLTLAAVLLAVTHFREAKPLESVVRFQVLPPDQVSLADGDVMSISPDGERLAFIGIGPDNKRQLWIRAINSLNATAIEGTESADVAFWSPDSQSVAFFAAGKLKRVDLQSGAVKNICDSPSTFGRSSGTWSRDNTILLATEARHEIYRVPATGGEAKVAKGPDASDGESYYFAPQFLPDGRHYIYFAQNRRAEKIGIYGASLNSNSSKLILNSYTNATYAGFSGGRHYLLFTRGSDLMAQSFDVAKLVLTGKPFLVTSGLSMGLAVFGIAPMSASQNGIMAYRTGTDQIYSKLVWVDREGGQSGTVGGVADFYSPALSPDGKKLIVSRTEATTRTRNLWLFDLFSGASSRFTFDAIDDDAVWSPDGSKVAYSNTHDGVVDLYEKTLAGISAPRFLLHSDGRKPIGWTPDGRFLLLVTVSSMWAVPIEGGVKQLGPFSMEKPSLSPNGRWIAYCSNESGRSEVYVQNFPPSERKWQISDTGGVEPQWRQDGKELFYVSGNKLVAMDVSTDPLVFVPGVAKPLFDVRWEVRRRRRYQVAANGQRFLINVPIAAPSPVTIVINWPTEGPPR